jgi:hypothetical protein
MAMCGKGSQLPWMRPRKKTELLFFFERVQRLSKDEARSRKEFSTPVPAREQEKDRQALHNPNLPFGSNPVIETGRRGGWVFLLSENRFNRQ